MNLGELAKKLLVNPIVSAGRAIGADYKNTVFGADWKEKSAMRKALFEARLRKMNSDISGDTETRAYTRALREAQAADVAARTGERMTKQQAVEAAARRAGVTVPEFLALQAEREMKLKDSLTQAKIELLSDQGELADARTMGVERWNEEGGGLDSLILRNKANAQRALREPRAPVARTGAGPKLPSDLQTYITMALSQGDTKKLGTILKGVSRTQLVNSFGEDHPVLQTFDSLRH